MNNDEIARRILENVGGNENCEYYELFYTCSY